jgi:hypothetical protein
MDGELTFAFERYSSTQVFLPPGARILGGAARTTSHSIAMDTLRD